MIEFRQRYQSDIGREGLNRFTEQDVAALAERLLRKAQLELVRAEARLKLLHQTEDHSLLSEEEHQEAIRFLSQPLVLLMAVREIADPNSSALANESPQLAKLYRIVSRILEP